MIKNQLSPQSLIGIRPNESVLEGVNRQISMILTPGPVGRLKYLFGITSRKNEITKLWSRLNAFETGLEHSRAKYVELCQEKMAQVQKKQALRGEIAMYERLIMFTDQMLEHCKEAVVKVQSRLGME